MSLGAPSLTQADEVYTFVVKKQEQKAKTRWSLSEWLETRDRMRLMDMWLAMNSPSPFEFFLGADYSLGQTPARPEFQGWNFSLGGYAQAVGLEFRHEALADSATRLSAAVGFRIFGYQIQGTHLALLAGLKQDGAGGASTATFRNPMLGGRMSLYLTKFFGIDGQYRHFFDSVPNETGTRISGDRFEGGAFLDFKFLRFFGTYYTETGAPEQKGVFFGSRLFF